MNCEHVFADGEKCKAPGMYITRYRKTIPICQEHRQCHELEFYKELDKLHKERNANITKKQEKLKRDRADFDEKLEKRELNYAEVIKRVENEVPQSLRVPVSKVEGETVIQAVDAILLELIKYYRVYCFTEYLTNFRVFISMMRGFSPEEIASELVKRGYRVENELDTEFSLYVKIVYFPDLDSCNK
jgi:hypothetical protein